MHYMVLQQPTTTNQFALAAARAIVPPRSQTPTLSAAAAAAALHASPKQVTSPGAVVTRRMERRGSVSSINSAPAHPGEDGTVRPGSRSGPSNRPPSREAAVVTTAPKKKKPAESRHAPTQDRVLSPTRPLESRHAPKTQRYQEEEEEPRKVTSKPRKAAVKPKATPVPVEPAPEPAPAVATKPKSKPKAKPKPKPKPVEPVYSSSSSDEEEEHHNRYEESSDEGEYEEQTHQSFQLKKTLRTTPGEAAARAAVKSKQQTHSDTQGSMLARGTMRTVVREDMRPIINEAKERHKPAPKLTKSALHESAHAPKTHHVPVRDDTGPSDEVKALALAIMRSQQAKAGKRPIIAPSKRAQRRRQAAMAPPDTAEDEEEAYEVEEAEPEEEELEKDMYKRTVYANSASSVGSFASDLESIPEEAGTVDHQPTGAKKKKRNVRESVIIPGKDGVPALPNSPILQKERSRLAKVQSPEPAENKAGERKRTLDKLTGDHPAAKLKDVAPPRELDERKGSPPSSATLTEEPFQPVIQTTPPTPPATGDKYNEPRFIGIDVSIEEAKPVKPLEAHHHAHFESSTPPETLVPKVFKRHSPPPRSLSPAKPALKHTHHEGSDRSSILSAEDGSMGGSVSGRRKHVRVSFSEDPAVVEMDDDQYHYKPIHSTLDKISAPKQPSKGISAVSFSSISRTRVEHTPSPEPPLEHSADSRLGGLLGGELLDKIKTKVSKGKEVTGPVSPSPLSPLSVPPSNKEPHPVVFVPGKGTKPSDPLAPEVLSMSPPPSISDEEFEDEPLETPPSLGVEAAQPAVPPPIQTVPVVEDVISEEPEEPRAAQISAGHTPPAVEVKPIFPPSTSDLTGNTATISENIAHGHPLEETKSDSDSEDHFSDAYEDLDHVVVSSTGSGAVLGVTVAHTTHLDAEASVAPAEEVVLPSIAEVVTDQPLDQVKLNSPPKNLSPEVIGGPLPEEAIVDPREEAQKIIVAPKPVKPVSPKLINARLTPPLQELEPEPIESEPEPEPKPVAVVPVTKPAAPKAAISKKKKKAAAPHSSALAESRHAPKPQQSQPKAAPVVAPVPPPAPSSGGKLKKQKHVPAPIPQRAASIDSEDSESSFQRENPHRREARRSQGKGFSMRTSMRDSKGVVPQRPSSSAGLAASRWSSPPTNTTFESGFRTGRTIGTGGPRRREYSPDSSDDDRKIISTKPEKKKGFLGKATLRGSGRPSSSHASSPKSTGKGKGVLGFKSRFDDSSDEELEPSSYVPQPTPAEPYRPLTPDSSDTEEIPRTNGLTLTPPKAGNTSTAVFIGKGSLRDSKHAPVQPNGFTTTITSDAEVTPKKKWWSFGSKRGSRPPSRAESTIVQPITPKPVLSRRTTDPESFSSPPPQRPQIKKFRKSSTGSVNSVGSSQSWTPMSLGTSTLTGGSPSGNRTLTHKLSGLEEVDEENLDRNSPVRAQTVEPNGDIYGSAKAQKKKKFPKLRKIFGIND
ncbi:hypothetical protein ABW19_dt0203374 [Dactylella cylindrospora]|nr:hypothetical protein ABW19_dt0203374 [Dactylella cylindrospora]